jgi:hypothetical protein
MMTNFTFFLWTIIGQPVLGEHVRYLSVTLEDIEADGDDIYVDPYPQDLLLFAAEVASRGLSQEAQQAILGLWMLCCYSSECFLSPGSP